MGLNLKELDNQNVPQSGEAMVYKRDGARGQTKESDDASRILNIRDKIKIGYSQIGFARCGCAAYGLFAVYKLEMLKQSSEDAIMHPDKDVGDQRTESLSPLRSG